MAAMVTRRDGETIEVSFTVSLRDSMLEMEEAVEEALNGAGRAAMAEALVLFDTDGSPIRMGAATFKTKGRFGQTYETPHGPVRVERNVYQNTATGGRTFCPLEQDARMVLNATPRYAKIVSGKYARMGADVMRRDLLESMGRTISRDYVKKIGDFVGALAQAKEAAWEYELPELDRPVASVSVGLDGTCMLLREEGWRQAMCGSISLYDKDGERLHTIYAGASPEYGKQTFRERFEREVERVKARHPAALYIGLADGAPDNWEFLEPRTDRQMLDFYHAREYVAKAAEAIHGHSPRRQEWEADWSHRLKHTKGAAKRLLEEMRANLPGVRGQPRRAELAKAITYFGNHRAKMQYWRHTGEHLPIGSGVTEAACKTLIKQRLACSGMRWKETGASAVIALRSLEMTEGRWGQFWQHVTRHGAT